MPVPPKGHGVAPSPWDWSPKSQAVHACELGREPPEPRAATYKAELSRSHQAAREPRPHLWAAGRCSEGQPPPHRGPGHSQDRPGRCEGDGPSDDDSRARPPKPLQNPASTQGSLMRPQEPQAKDQCTPCTPPCPFWELLSDPTHEHSKTRSFQNPTWIQKDVVRPRASRRYGAGLPTLGLVSHASRWGRDSLKSVCA